MIAQLLTEMDGVEGREGVIVVAATNRPELIDPALLRPGRFDLVVELAYPNEDDRRAIFEIHTKGRPLSPDISIEELARLTEGRSGADIEAICRRAALLALRDWIAPRLIPGRVLITEESGESSASNAEEESLASPSTSASMPPTPRSPLLILPKHFAAAIEEQQERYDAQDEIEEARARKEAGRQRLIDMAAQMNDGGKRPLRGIRLWLARLFRLV